MVMSLLTWTPFDQVLWLVYLTLVLTLLPEFLFVSPRYASVARRLSRGASVAMALASVCILYVLSCTAWYCLF